MFDRKYGFYTYILIIISMGAKREGTEALAQKENGKNKFLNIRRRKYELDHTHGRVGEVRGGRGRVG